MSQRALGEGADAAPTSPIDKFLEAPQNVASNLRAGLSNLSPEDRRRIEDALRLIVETGDTAVEKERRLTEAGMVQKMSATQIALFPMLQRCTSRKDLILIVLRFCAERHLAYWPLPGDAIQFIPNAPPSDALRLTFEGEEFAVAVHKDGTPIIYEKIRLNNGSFLWGPVAIG